MDSFKRLSELTGYQLDYFKRILDINAVLLPEQKVLPIHLNVLCKIAHKAVKELTYILISDGAFFYRGVILQDIIDNCRSYTKRYLTVAYKGADGNRHIVVVQSHGYYGFFLCFENPAISAYQIDFSESLFTLQEPPILEGFNELEQYDLVSVGHNSKGAFFMDRNNNRISVYFDSIRRDIAGCFVIEKDSFFGIANNYGTVILNPLYQVINPFSDGLASILGYREWGFVNIEGIIVIPFHYETVEPFINGISRVSVTYDLCGFINKEGNGVIIIKDLFIEFPEYCFIMQEGDSFCGLLHEPRNNNEGQRVKFSIPALNSDLFISQKACKYMFIGDCIVAKKDGHKYLYSHNGDSFNIIDDCNVLDYCRKYNEKSQSFDGQIVRHIKITNLPFYYVVSQGNRKGVINNSGDIIVPIEYEYIGLLSSHVILAYDGDRMRLFSTTPFFNGQKCEYSFTQSYERIEKIEESWDSKKELNQFYVYNKNKVGFVFYKDGLLETVFPCVFDKIDYSYYSTWNNENKHNGTFIIDGISIKDDILNARGDIIRKPSEYLWMADYSFSGIAVALKDCYFGLVDSDNNSLIDFSYDGIFKISAFHYILFKEEKIQLICFDLVFHVYVLQDICGDNIARLFSNTFTLSHNGVYSVFSYDAETQLLVHVGESSYNSIRGIDDTFIVVENDGLFGCINVNGDTLLDIKYNDILSPKEFLGQEFLKKTESKLLSNNLLMLSLRNGEKELFCLTSGKHILVPKHQSIHFRLFHDDNCSDGGFFEIWGKGIFVVPLDCSCIAGPFDEIETSHYFNQYGITTKKSGKYGFINPSFTSIIPCIFDSEGTYENYFHRFWKVKDSHGEYIFYDIEAGMICPIKSIKSIRPITPTKNSLLLISFNDPNGNEKRGVYTRDYRNVFDELFRSIDFASDGQLILSSLDNRYGIIDYYGSFVYPLSKGRITYEYSLSFKCSVYRFYNEDERLHSISNDGIHILDVDEHFEEGYEPLMNGHVINKRESDGTIDFVANYGKEYSNIVSIKDQYVIQDKKYLTILEIGGKFMVIDEQQQLTECLYDEILLKEDSRFITARDNNHYSFFSLSGDPIGEITGDFTDFHIYAEDNIICAIREVSKSDVSYWLYSCDGTQLIDQSFSYIGDFNEGFAPCAVNGRKRISDDFFRHVESVVNDWFIDRIDDYGIWGIINNKGEIVIPCRFDYIKPIKNGMTVYLFEHLYGVINPYTRMRTVPKFKYLQEFSEGLCAYFDSSPQELEELYGYGYINADGEIVIPRQFYKACPFSNGTAIVKSSSGYYNHINTSGVLQHEWIKNPQRNDEYYEDNDGYTQSELDDMYRGAYEDDSSAQWNTW